MTNLLSPIVRLTYAGGGGSSTAVYSNNGKSYLLTNDHVVKNARLEGENLKVEVFDHEDYEISEFRGVTVAYHIPGDLALVKLLDDVDLAVAKFYLGDPLKVGDELIAAGSTLYSLPFVHSGEVAHLNDLIDGYTYNTSNAFTESGNSGGPVYLAATGEFVGLNARIDEERGLSYYIPIDRIISFLDENKFQFIYERQGD